MFSIKRALPVCAAVLALAVLADVPAKAWQNVGAEMRRYSTSLSQYLPGSVSSTDPKPRVISEFLRNEDGFQLLAVHPEDPLTAFAVDEEGELYMTEDRGDTWVFLEAFEEGSGHKVVAMAVDPIATDHYVAVSDRGQVSESKDGGENWELRDYTVPVSGRVTSVAVAPVDEGTVLAFGTSEGEVAFTDRETATRPRNVSGAVTALAFDLEDANIVYAGFDDTADDDAAGQVFRSVSHGASWTRMDGTAPDKLPDARIWAILLHPDFAGRIYAATEEGVFVTPDGGTRWFLEADVKPGAAVALAVDAGGLAVLGKDMSLSAGPVERACTYQVTPLTASFNASGGTGTIRIDASSSTCSWTITSVPSWMRITSGGTRGRGDARITYTIAANTVRSRTDSVRVAGKTFRVTQSGPAAACASRLDPSSRSIPSDGGTGTIAVTWTSGRGCRITVTGHPSWVTVRRVRNSTRGGTVSYTVAANGEPAPREVVFKVANSDFRLRQETSVCILQASASFSNPVPAEGGDFPIIVSAAPGYASACAGYRYSVSNNVSWISNGISTRTGPQTVLVHVNPNVRTIVRQGTVRVGSLPPFEVIQAAAQQ